MFRFAVCIVAALACMGSMAAGLMLPADLTAEQLAEKNAAARGGVEAWRKIEAVAWSGRIETATRPNLPFVLEQKRPNKTRFELLADEQKSVRIFDGNEGWKMKASSKSPRPDVQSYTARELSFARSASVIDGPLMDFHVRRYPLEIEGLDSINGRQAYRLHAALPSGQVQRVWVDAQTFLELRFDRQSWDSGGRPITVSVYYENYKTFDGLQMPMSIETRSGDSTSFDRIVIEKLALNPTLEDSLFAKPRPTGSRTRGVVVDTRSLLQSSSAAPSPAR